MKKDKLFSINIVFFLYQNFIIILVGRVKDMKDVS